MTSTCSASPGPGASDDRAAPCETWMVFVDPESGVRASGVIALAYRQHLPVRAKETCFGLIVEGESAVIRGFVGRLRAEFPAGLFLKRRPFSIGDTKVCARTFRRLGIRRAAEQLKYHNHC